MNLIPNLLVMKNNFNWILRQFIHHVGGMDVGVVLVGPIKSLLHGCRGSSQQSFA